MTTHFRCTRKPNLRSLALILSVIGILRGAAFAAVVDFEEMPLHDGFDYEDGTWLNGSGSFTSQNLSFNNNFTDWGFFTSWDGWAYSRVGNVTTPGYMNQFAAYSASFVPGMGAGAGGSHTYAVAYDSGWGSRPTINIPAGQSLVSAQITNTTYAYMAVAFRNDGNTDIDGNPDPWVKQFTTGDYFKVTVTGKDEADKVVGSIAYYLADYRAAADRADNGRKDNYVLNDWSDIRSLPTQSATGTPLSFGTLARARTLELSFDTTDLNSGGYPNTPFYLAVDNLQLAPNCRWSGGSGSFSTASWSVNPLTSGAILRFANPSAMTSTNDLTGRLYNGLSFEAGAAAATIEGAGVKMAGNVVNDSAATQTLKLPLDLQTGGGTFDTAAGDLRVEGKVSGDTGLTKVGSHTLTLGGDGVVNEYQGDTTVAEGRLEIANADALPETTTLNILGGTVVLDGGPNQAVKVQGLRLNLPPRSSSGPAVGTTTVPEPATWALMIVGAVGLALRFGKAKRQGQ